MHDIDTSPAALRALAEAATPGPWQVVTYRTPFSITRHDGTTCSGEHVGRDIATVRHHPQSHAPYPIVTLGIGVTQETPVHFVFIRPEDADYLAAVSPEVVLALLDTIDALRASLAAAEKERDALRLAMRPAMSDKHKPAPAAVEGDIEHWKRWSDTNAATAHRLADYAKTLEVRLDELVAERDSIKALYEAGVSAWQPVYEILLGEKATAEARAEKAEAERDAARKVIAWANNSLYGSHGFFLSLDGGPANEHHLDNGIEELKDIVRRKFSNGTAMIWHPIETAPKDGTPIDLWAGERIANCTWNAPSACWDERIGTGYGGKHWAVMSAPTHWMPLPAAPTNPEDAPHA